MKKKVWIGLGIVLSIVLFTTIAVVQSQGSNTYEVDVVNPEVRTMKQEIMVPGEMKLAEVERVAISTDVDYTLLVEVGDRVEVDTPIIEYSNSDLDFEQKQHAIQLEAGYLRINQIGKQEDHLEEKEEKLAKDIGKKEAKDQLRSEREQLDYEKRAANLDLRQLLNQKEQLEKRADDLIEESPIAGEVLQIDQGAEAMITIAQKDTFIASGNLSEYDSLEIKVGQSVKITSDAMFDQAWSGAIDHIDFFPSQNDLDGTGIKYPFTVEVKEGATSLLRPGYQVILHVVSDEREALTVPSSAVRQLDQVAYVYKIEDGLAVEQEVDLGLHSDGYYEIRSGLTESDKIVLELPEGLKDRSEVMIVD